MSEPTREPEPQQPRDADAAQDRARRDAHRSRDRDLPPPDDGDLPLPEPLPDVEPARRAPDGEEGEPLPEPEPLEPYGTAGEETAGERSGEDGWVRYDRWRDVDVPPLREVTAPNERDRGEDQTAGPIAAWTFADLRDAAGRASCADPGPGRPEPSPPRPDTAARQPREAPEGTGTAAPRPGPGEARRSRPETARQPGRTPFWGTPAARPEAAPHATAAGPGRNHSDPGKREPARPPHPPAGQHCARSGRVGEPRFAPARPPGSPAASITQGRPYVPPVPLSGSSPVAGHGAAAPPVPPGPRHPAPVPGNAPGWHTPPPVPQPWSGPQGPVPPPAPVRFAPPRPPGAAAWPQPRVSAPADAAEDDAATGTHRLHGATVALQVAVVALVFLALPGPFLLQLGLGWALLALLVVVLGAVAVSVVSWYRTRFGLVEDRLVVRTGLLRQRLREVPLSRLQAVDVVRPLFMQVVGLSELRVEVAGGDRGEIRLRYLGRRRAERLRATLLAYAAGLSGRVPEAPETPLYQLRFSLLIGALVFRIPVLAAFVLFSLLIATGLAFEEPGVLGGAVPLLLGLLHGFLEPLLRYIDFYASLSPDGLRLRYGVFQARMQTVPPGRVQAVRIVEPLLWRWLRVVRVEANIAGYAGQRQTESATLLPVVPAALAYELLRVLFPGSDVDSVRFSPGVRGGGREEMGLDDSLFVTRRGRFCRVVEIVPHARMQAVRLRMGPVERRRGTAALEVETPPGPVRAHVSDRGPQEARAALDRIVALARRARAETAGPERWATRGEPEP